MALSIDWPTQVINVPKADMLLVQSNPTEIRELDIDAFRLELKSIESSTEGMPFLDTHSHNPPVTVGGVTLARVVEIINGYTVTFEDGQYAVNLVGANSNIGDVTNVNQVSVRSANSAGLTYSKEIEDQSFEDARVWLNTIIGSAGTQFPIGTPGTPSSNLVDTKSIITNRILPKRIKLKGTLISLGGENLDDYNVQGESSLVSAIVAPFGISTDNTVLDNLTIIGDIQGRFSLTNGLLQDVTNFEGSAGQTGLGGTITLTAITPSNAIYGFTDCLSVVPGSGTPVLDCNDAANLQVQFRRYAGGIEIRNYTDSSNIMTIDLSAGHVILDSSCTAGQIVIRGVGHYTNNSSIVPITEGLTYGESGLTAEESAQLGQIDIVRKLFMNRMETNPTTGVMTIYDDDDVSILYSGNIYEDVLATQLYRGQGVERRNRLT